MVQLGILVVAEPRVIAADRAKGVDPHQGVVTVIHPGPAARQPVGRTAIAQARILRLGNDLLQKPLALGMHRDHDAVGTGLLRLGQQRVAVIGGIIAVRIQPQQPFGTVPEPLHGQVHPRRLQPAWIVDQPDQRIGRGTAPDDVAGRIGRAAIGDHDQPVRPRRKGRSKGQDAVDMARLVQGRNDDQHMGF